MKQANNDQTQRLARYLARMGRQQVEQFQLVVNEALRLLDESRPVTLEAQPEPYSWEQADAASPDRPRAVYLATVQDYGTGVGLTVHFVAVLAGSEDEARRYLARLLGRNLAQLAILVRGADGIVPFARLFLSPELRASLQRIQEGDEGPAAFSYQARYHMNLS